MRITLENEGFSFSTEQNPVTLTDSIEIFKTMLPMMGFEVDLVNRIVDVDDMFTTFDVTECGIEAQLMEGKSYTVVKEENLLRYIKDIADVDVVNDTIATLYYHIEELSKFKKDLEGSANE